MRPAIAVTFQLRVIAESERAVAVWISAAVWIEIQQTLVLRLNLNAAKGFQFDLSDHDETPPLGSSPLIPSVGLGAFGSLDLLWRPLAISSRVSANQIKTVKLPADSAPGYPPADLCRDVGKTTPCGP
jgi:hypothetical protein